MYANYNLTAPLGLLVVALVTWGAYASYQTREEHRRAACEPIRTELHATIAAGDPYRAAAIAKVADAIGCHDYLHSR